MTEPAVRGISLATFSDGQIRVETSGVANAETEAPVTASTLFQAASVSKMATAAAALAFHQSAALERDGAFNDHLKSWRIPSNEFTDRQAVTLAHLLSHTAGATVEGFSGYGEHESVPSLLQVLDGAPPANSPPVVIDQPPGRSFRYSGGGYAIVQQGLIDVWGRTFPDLMLDTVLGPSGMSRSTFEQPLPPRWFSDVSAGHLPDGTVVPGGYHAYPEMAAAGLWTTAEDLAKLAMELQRALAGQSEAVLSQELAKLMMTPVTNDYAFGIIPVNHGGESYFSHAGRNQGFESLVMAHMTAGVGIAIMINGWADQFIWQLMQYIGKRERFPGF